MFSRAITGHLNGAFFMAEFHDYRPFGADLEHYPLDTELTECGTVKIIINEKFLYICLAPLEAKQLIEGLQSVLDDLREQI